MSKHTPGPYEINAGRFITVPNRQFKGHNATIAQFFSWVGLGEADANARLFVGSLDLLSAAKLQILNFERAQASGSFLGDDDHEAWTALSRAVAKVEGGAQ